MTTFPCWSRRVARSAARAATIASGAMVVVSAWAMWSPRLPGADAATDAGDAQVIAPLTGAPGAGDPLTSGGSATDFSLRLPVGAACTGDSANDGYRVQSFMTPAGVDPATLRFDADGPVPNGLGATFRQPLYDTTGSGYINQQTANADIPGGAGVVVNIAAFDFSVYEPGNIPAGAYNVGIACTLGPSSATQVDRFWDARMDFVASAADLPAGVRWTVTSPTTTTTTTTGPSGTTSTTGPTSSSSTTSTTSTSTSTTTTSTTPSSSTTSTVAGGTTSTTVSPVNATASVLPASASATPSGGAPTFSPALVGSVSELARTGGSTMSLLVWSALLVAFGRIAVLLGRSPQVRPGAGQ